MSILKESFEKIRNGAPFYVDFRNRNLFVGRKCVIRNGECDNTEFQYSFSDIEYLYRTYKHSVPTATKRRFSLFYSLPEEELSDEDMMYGIDRHTAKAMLELAILKSLIDGTLTWESLADNPGHFFWQAPFDKDLVIYRALMF